MGRPTAVPPTCGRPCWTRQSLVIRCLLLPCARILSRGKSLLGGRAEPIGNRLSCAETGVCSSRRSHKEGYQIILLKFISLSYGLPSVVYSIYHLPSILPSVVRVRRLSRGLPSAVHIRLFVAPFVDGLPLPDRLKPVLRCAVRRLQHLSSTVHPAVCRSCLSPAVCGLPSAVHIRLFVAPFVDGLPPRQARKPVLRCASSTVYRPTAVCRPRSAVYRCPPSPNRSQSLSAIPSRVAPKSD